MDEKTKALLELVGKLIKDELAVIKEGFEATLKEVSSSYEEKINTLKKEYSEQLDMVKESHGVEVKAIHEKIDEIELTPGEKGEPGQDGKSVELEDVITSLISDDQFMKQIKGEKGEPGENGLSVDAKDVAVILAEDELFRDSIKGDKGEQGEKGLDGESVELDDVVKTLKADDEFMTIIKGEKGEKGDRGEQGERGLDGTFTKARAFVGDVVKQYDFVMHKGALWQNLMEDNNTEPSLENKSYQCVISKPENGKSITPKGLYNPEETYSENDTVMFNNASWIKNSKDAQELPGEGWFLLAKGTKGAKGDQGEKGEPGEPTDITKDLEERVHLLEAKSMVVAQ